MNLAAFVGVDALTIFRKIAFELKSYPDDVVQAHIDLANMMFCAEQYGDAADLFLALMAAHLMVIPGGIAAKAGTGSAPAGVKMVKEGDLTIQYQDTATDTSTASFTAWLGKSRFGDLIQMLRRQRGLGLGFTAVGFSCGEDGGYYFPNRAIH